MLHKISANDVESKFISELSVQLTLDDGDPKDPCKPDPCGSNTDKHISGNNACECMCKPNYFGNPKEGCKRECEISSDCPIDMACDNYRCKDPCVRAGCAYNALCTAVNHQAICLCPESMTGNPYDECVSETTTSKL